MGKTVQDWFDAIQIFKSLDPPMSQAMFLKSSISGDLFSGTQSERQIFSRRLKEFDKGKFKDKNLNVKKLAAVGFPEVESKLVRYLELRERNYQRDKLGVDWNYLKNKAFEFADALGVEDFKASDGWLSNVLKRSNKHGIKLHGEAGEMSPEEIVTIIEDWKKNVLHPMMGSVQYHYESKNRDEKGLAMTP